MVFQGTAQIETFVDDVPMDGLSRSSNDRRGRCQETLFGSHYTVDMMSKSVALLFSRFGLRGVRVGEASNRGPRRELTEDDPDGVLASLGHGLTRMIDDSSDDEPLSRPEGGKNVVRRLDGDIRSGRHLHQFRSRRVVLIPQLGIPRCQDRSTMESLPTVQFPVLGQRMSILMAKWLKRISGLRPKSGRQ